MKHTPTIILVLAFLMVGASCSSRQSAVLPTTSDQAQDTQLANTNDSGSDTVEPTRVTWMQTGNGWQASGPAPDCPTPLLRVPVPIAAVSSVLYPGQLRGGQYKAHGGFRFDGATKNAVQVTIPMEARVIAGARYIEGGETQYLFDFEHPCGIRFRFDHLHTLTPIFAALAEQLPAPRADDSRTTNFSDPALVSAGDVVATEVGFIGTKNASVDFGVYDLRQRNVASQSSAYVAAHANDSLALNAVCWLDLLTPADGTALKALPAGDQASGKRSDYCS